MSRPVKVFCWLGWWFQSSLSLASASEGNESNEDQGEKPEEDRRAVLRTVLTCRSPLGGPGLWVTLLCRIVGKAELYVTIAQKHRHRVGVLVHDSCGP